MKRRILLFTFGMFAFLYSGACDGPGEGSRDDINGFVISSIGKKPLRDVSVTAYVDARKEKVTFTDTDGSFSFDDLKPGTYKLVFEKAGYKKVTKEKVLIKTDEAYQLNIELIEIHDFEIMPSPAHFNGF